MKNLDELIRNNVPSLVPDEVWSVKDYDGQPFEYLKTQYESNKIQIKLAASLLTALFTCNMPVFMLSQRLMLTVIGKDPNLERKTLSGSEYALMIRMLTETKDDECPNGIIKLVYPGSGYRTKGKHIASFYELGHLPLLGYMIDVEERREVITAEYLKLNPQDKILKR